MPNNMTTPRKKGQRKSKLITRLLLPMMLLVVLQLVALFSVLIIGGEFSYVEQSAYNTLVERTENRKGFIENELQQKMPFVSDAADRIDRRIASILIEEGATIADIQTNRELNNRIMESTVDNLVDLLRRSAVNDAFLILETGDLYSEDGGSANAKAALYLRDLDTMTDGGYEDLLMEIGLTSISREFGIILDAGWMLHFSPEPKDTENYGFYYQTISNAQEYSALGRSNLGYWSGFSKFSQSAAASMKYTLPLVAADGTVYGVLGIGLTENTILASLPANDFINETACYVLTKKRNDRQYSIITHSGTAYSTLLGDPRSLQIAGTQRENVYEFETGTGIDLVGSVQPISMYQQESPYRTEQWALVSVADRTSVLMPLTNLIRWLIVAAVISVILGTVVAFVSIRRVVRPISGAIKIMNANTGDGEVIHFKPTNIEEYDRIADAITQLQINVQDFSSQVSQMIRIANVGLGTFMYNRSDDTIFVGQNLLRVMHASTELSEDVIMSRHEFMSTVAQGEHRKAIAEGLQSQTYSEQTEYVREYSIEREDGSTRWMRLSLVNNNNKSIGILQDITSEMMEKKRIEYERDYDGTTGLLNRHAYYRRLAELFQDKEALRVTAIIMMDLDNLKYVNDTYGHDFGDDYIKTAANALKKFHAYGGVVSRLSGDEFNICLSGFSSREEIWEIIQTVRAQLLQSSCLLADGTHFKVRASMGVAWYPDDAATYELLMKYADFAMYTIKHSRKGGIAEFDMSTYSTDSVLLTGVEEMNRIIDERSVRYAFQSIVNARTGEVYGYEALMRPQSSIFQTQLELMRTAKTGAKLYEIERLTWLKALEDFKTQVDAGHIGSDCRVFINSITNCMLEDDDVSLIETTYADLLTRIVLEIVQDEQSNGEYTAQKLKCMKKWNAQVALDDFGISFNNEHVLATIQPGIIKIDRSIISGCDKDMSRRSIIRTLVKLARAKHILVLAGGVETEEEMEAVISCGVDLLQGYYINRPLFEPELPEATVIQRMMQMADKASDASHDAI